MTPRGFLDQAVRPNVADQKPESAAFRKGCKASERWPFSAEAIVWQACPSVPVE